MIHRLRAAYDHLPRGMLLGVLNITTGCKKLVDMLKYHYKNTTAQNGHEVFETYVGCRQSGQEGS